MESPSFYQPAVVPVSPATSPASALVNVPARVIEFAYDGLSRRIRKKVTEGASTIAVWEAYVYDGWNMVLSVKLNPAVGTSQGRPQSAIASYVWRPDLGSLPFARRNWQAAGGVRGLVMANYFTGANGGGIHLPVMDAMGNVTQVVRAGVQLNYNGESMRSEFVYDYDAFGKETRSSTLVAGLNQDSFPFHFSTKFTDPESGFNYYGYRFYDPANGRWINRDPIGERGGVNVYGMVGNDSANFVDYLGLIVNFRGSRAAECEKAWEKVKKSAGCKAAALMRALEDSKKIHTLYCHPLITTDNGDIREDGYAEVSSNTGGGLRPDGSPGSPQDTTWRVDTSTPTKDGVEIPLDAKLAHEAYHASGYDQGTFDNRDLDREEQRASMVENDYRESMGYPIRETYTREGRALAVPRAQAAKARQEAARRAQ